MNHDTPVNKDAALFLSRKKRVQTVQEALNKLAIEVCSTATVMELRKIMRERIGPLGIDAGLKITLTLKPDGSEPNRVWCSMETKIETHVGRETYSNLEL